MQFPRTNFDPSVQDKIAETLQSVLVNLVDFNLQVKQAHWNLVGPNFTAVHEQLDELATTYRGYADEVAERILAVGEPADGRVDTVARDSGLQGYPAGLQSVSDTVRHIADRLEELVRVGRYAQQILGEYDPASEDLVIALLRDLEKHLWMFQAQELGAEGHETWAKEAAAS